MPNLAEVKARTEARKAAGLIPDYSKQALPSPKKDYSDCTNRGNDVIDSVQCPSCKGVVHLKVYECKEYPSGCTIGTRVEGLACCDNMCPRYASAKSV